MSEIKAIKRVASLFPDVAEFYENQEYVIKIMDMKQRLAVVNNVTAYTTCLLNLNLITKEEQSEIVNHFTLKLNDDCGADENLKKIPLYRLAYKYFLNKRLFNNSGNNKAQELMLSAENELCDILGV